MNTIQDELSKLIDPNVNKLTGIVGLSTTLVEVSNRPGFVWVRLDDGDVVQAHNRQVSNKFGLPVFLAFDGVKYEITGLNTNKYPDWGTSNGFVANHASQHSAMFMGGGGGDVVWVDSQQILPALVVPTGETGTSNVCVVSYIYKNTSGDYIMVGEEELYIPPCGSGGMSSIQLVAIHDSDGSAYVVEGTPFASSISGTVNYLSQIPNPTYTNDLSLAAVLRQSSVSGTVVQWDEIIDLRQFFGNNGGGGGGGINFPASDGQYYAAKNGAWATLPSGTPGANLYQTFVGISGLIEVDMSLGSGEVILVEDSTLLNPTNLTAGNQNFMLVKQDSVGSHLLSYEDNYYWPGGVSPVLSTTPYKMDLINMVSDGIHLICSIANNVRQLLAAIVALNSTPSYDSDGGGSADTLTFTHNVLSGSNRLLMIAIGTRAYSSVASVTFNGVACTFLDYNQYATDNNGRVELWYLLAPDVGSYDVVVTMAAGDQIGAGALSFKNVHQTTPFTDLTKSRGIGDTEATISVPSQDGNIVFAAITHEGLSTTDGTQTEDWNISINGNWWTGAGHKSGSGMVDFSWAVGTNSYGIIGVSINPIA